MLDTLRDSHKAGVVVWKKGWPRWKNLRDTGCEALWRSRDVRIKAPDLVKEHEYDPEITAVRVKKQSSPFYTRKSVRFKVNYPVTIFSGGQELQTVCLDLSSGGLRVQDPMPDWVAGYSSLILTVEDGRQLEIMCSVAEDQQHSKTRFEIVPSENQSEFLDWFAKNPRFQQTSGS